MHLNCTVEELLSRVSSRELTEWMAYDQVEPLPDRRTEVLLATLLALTVNIHRDPKQSDPMRALDFLPWLREEADDDEGITQTAMVRWIEQMNIAMGGRDERHE